MLSEALYFYLLFIVILIGSAFVIFAPRMYLAVLSLFVTICASSLLYLTLNANFLAVFQFILCGLILSVFIFVLLKKISRLNLKLKLVPWFKIVMGCLFTMLFGVLACLFVKEEFNNSFYAIFNFISEKSEDVVNLSNDLFPLHLVIILLLVSALIVKVFVSRQSEDS